MKVLRINDLSLQFFAPENLSFAELFQSSRISVALGVIQARESQTLHVHNRPDNGDEIEVIFSGSFELAGPETFTHDADKDGPMLVSIKSGERVILKNVENRRQVRFISIFAPPFDLQEVTFENA